MKTQSKELIQLVSQLGQLIEARKEIEKHEIELRGQIRLEMGEEMFLEAGDLYVSIETRTRSDLDKDALQHDLGPSFFQKYQKKIQYEILTVKPLRRHVVVNLASTAK